MDLFANLTDDQLALLGCLAAVVVSATLMSLSYYVGPAHRASKVATRQLPHIERMKQAARDDERKAA